MNEPSTEPAHERFELLAKATHDAVWDWNLVTNQVWWNEEFMTLFGHQSGLIEDGTTFWVDKIHPADHQRVHDTIYKAINEGQTNWSDEYRFLKADGSYAYVNDRGYTLFQDGRAIRMVGAMQDITQQVANLARQQQAEQLKFVTDSALTAIGLYSIIRDKDTGEVIDLRYELINQMAQRMTGRPASDLIGRTMLAVFPGTALSGIWQQYKELATTGVPLHYQNHYTYEGYDLWYQVQGVRHGDWIVLSFLDITELKKTQLQLESLNRDLVRSNQSLQQFAYIASHDLQEPLRKIQSFGDILKSSYANQLGDGVGHLERMQSAASRMSGLIKDLLNFSRISTQHDKLVPVSLEQVVERVLDDLALPIQEKQASVQVESLPMVSGDELQLQQLFQNLLSNALKFNRPAVSPVIRISAQLIASVDLPDSVKPVRQVSAYHRISVSDNGIGFDEQYLERIFQVFQRLHTRSQYAGTGIGLAICEKVATNHGGAITASSTMGEGATFDVYLPADA
ncbi:sensor histidine kinase [Spirosoma agri]|uniref:histidine kinase n=1 Tax=Spirosoma agri TaxID=1987381 RepID=A0A6M0IEJ8_9BACT|nr:ATP-binding protein [Spirosoma agri]NEU66624.1 PAS domain-containing protein [Spirosoma agri]